MTPDPLLEPRSTYLDVAGHEIHLTQWGPEDGPALVMWHGLARTGRDFDTAARHYAAKGRRVICPDTIGRGLSSWSKEPDKDYTPAAYAEHALSLLDQLGVEACDWVGTSMGGLVGMVAAAGVLKGRIRRLVLNDIAPVLNPEAVARIKAYVGFRPDFGTLRELEQFLRAVYAPFGRLTDQEWRTMTETSYRRRDDGRLTTHYDPAVMTVFAAMSDDIDLWPVYEAVECPALVLRGEASDLVQQHVVEDMTRRGPKARLALVPGCGHAPALNVPEQLAVLDGFLEG